MQASDSIKITTIAPAASMDKDAMDQTPFKQEGTSSDASALRQQIANLNAELAARDAKQAARDAEHNAELAARDAKHNAELADNAPQTLGKFLDCCHENLISVTQIGPNPVKSELTKPTNRRFPIRIKIWTDFTELQDKVWDDLDRQGFTTRMCSSLDQVRERCDAIPLLEAESDLETHQSQSVQHWVNKLFNLKNGQNGPTRVKLFSRQSVLSIPLASRKSTGDGRLRRSADQCAKIEQVDGDLNKALAFIEYKPPHLLTEEMAIKGLAADFNVKQEVFGHKRTTPEEKSRYDMAGVLTQLYEYMVNTQTPYAYVTTGKLYVFVHLAKNPETMLCSVSIPERDYAQVKNGRPRWQKSAVGQVFAFLLQSESADPVDQAWIDKTRTTPERWPQEYENPLEDIPETERTTKEASEFKGKGIEFTGRSPHNLRSRCKPLDRIEKKGSESDDDPDKGSPTAQARSRAQKESVDAKTSSQSALPSGGKSSNVSASDAVSHAIIRIPIDARPYCSHQCLLGLMKSLPVDRTCPNAHLHARQHISVEQFQMMIRSQLATDRGTTPDCMPLWIEGARGSLLKVCLTSHGYTMVAKGTNQENHKYLDQEARIYSSLAKLQGIHVPVCLGTCELVKPYYYRVDNLVVFLFLSWAGVSLCRVGPSIKNVETAKHIQGQISIAMAAVHDLGILHHDAEPQNIMVDDSRRNIMLIDFERSEDRGPLLRPSRTRKRVSSVPDSPRKMFARAAEFERSWARLFLTQALPVLSTVG